MENGVYCCVCNIGSCFVDFWLFVVVGRMFWLESCLDFILDVFGVWEYLRCVLGFES